MQIKAVVLFLTATLLGSASAFCSKDDCCFKDNVARDKHDLAMQTAVLLMDMDAPAKVRVGDGEVIKE
ncbi:hypothetical protein CABS03_10168 [Colletotrichum abscissum]|uniref:Uncharacterized protein n=1 Tax=Colletotrichum abscissum TaxID=1671311 RepID=A0A9P9X4T8_9PEZI|nr:hypothetical protein CABS02_12548 [Colletotrichum abscissum]